MELDLEPEQEVAAAAAAYFEAAAWPAAAHRAAILTGASRAYYAGSKDR
jgi:hypothetical protein